jgi:hypothetical protein
MGAGLSERALELVVRSLGRLGLLGRCLPPLLPAVAGPPVGEEGEALNTATMTVEGSGTAVVPGPVRSWPVGQDPAGRSRLRSMRRIRIAHQARKPPSPPDPMRAAMAAR